MPFYVHCRPEPLSTATVHMDACVERDSVSLQASGETGDGKWLGPFDSLQHACREAVRKVDHVTVHSCIGPR
jgi:hypothetical protein